MAPEAFVYTTAIRRDMFAGSKIIINHVTLHGDSVQTMLGLRQK